MRKINSKFTTKFISESGSLLQNKDYFAFVELDKYAIYVVADGIDEDIELSAAKTAVTRIISGFEERPSLRKSRLKQLLKDAGKELVKQSRNQRLKASVSVVVTDYVKIRYATVGNTRFHLFRGGFIKSQSKDQSFSQQMVEKERLELDKLAVHEEKNNLYCFLGQDGPLDPCISKKIRLKDGDAITLQTRGVWENTDCFEILDVLDGSKEPQEVVDGVEEMILSRQPEKLENYTLAVIFIDKTYQDPKRRQKIKKIIMTLVPILIIVAVLSVMIYTRHKKKAEEIAQMEYRIKNAREYIGDENYIRANEEYKTALKLAEKVKDDGRRDEIDRYYKLTETVIGADEAMYAGEYRKALDGYLAAREKSYHADNIAAQYISRRMETANAHIDVMDLIRQGDGNMENGNMHAARKQYSDARDLASSIFFKDGRKEALDKIGKIDEELSKLQKEEEEEQKAAREEEEKSAKDDMQTRLDAIEIAKKGDISYSVSSYYDAKMYYTMAKEMYSQVYMHEMADSMEEKIQIVEIKIEEMETQRSKAATYSKDGDLKFEEGKLNEAKMLYIFAKEICQKSELVEEVELLEEKIKTIDSLIQNPSEGS